MLIEYSPEHIALLLRNIEDCSVEERVDIGRVIRFLKEEDRRFLWYVLRGYSLRGAGRQISKPLNTARRFAQICRTLSMFLS